MKKLLSWIITLSVILSMFTLPAFAATKLTTAETNIVKAYQKTVETGDAQYINKYKYPGVTFTSDLNDEGSYCKILNPQYSKVYDSKLKMNKLMIKGLLLVTDGQELTLGNINWGMYIKSKSNKAYAYQEVDDTDDIDFVSIDDLSDSTVTAIEKYLTSIYDEDTAYALMYPEDEDEDESGLDDEDIIYDGDEDDEDVDDSDISSGSVGSLSSPVPLNQKYTWSRTQDYIDDTISGTYSVTVKSFKKVTTAEVEKLGFKKPEAENGIEYALVDIAYEVKDASIKKVSGDGKAYLSTGWNLEVYGIKTPDGATVTGVNDYGFDGCLEDKLDDVVGFKELTPGKKESFKMQGKILTKIFKNKSNYLQIEIKDYKYNDDSCYAYFKLN